MAKFPSLNWCWVSSEREHEDGVVATLEALRELHSRHIPRAGLVNASFRFFFPRVGGRHQRI